MSLPPTGRLLALDPGARRTGLALSDETQRLASPLGALTRRPGKRFPMRALLDLIQAHRPAGVLVGLPLTGEGTEAEGAAGARQLAARIGEAAALPVELWDERMTTARALAAIRDMGGNTRGRKEDVDALAAVVLLQHYLDSRRERHHPGPGA